MGTEQHILDLLLHPQADHRNQGLELLESLGSDGLQGFVQNTRARGLFALLAAEPEEALVAQLPALLKASGQSPASLLRETTIRCRWSIRHLIHCRVFLSPEQTAAGDADPSYPPGGYGYMLFFNEGWVYSRALAAEDDLVAILDQPQWLHVDNEPGLPTDHPHLAAAPQAPPPPDVVDFMSRETDGDMTPDALYDAKHQLVADFDDLDGYEEDIYLVADAAADQLEFGWEAGEGLSVPRGSLLWQRIVALVSAP